MSAAVRLFRSSVPGNSAFDTVPEERIKSLKLSVREVEMAERLFISPATVRTHIYNIYQKAGAKSRVELLNILRN